MSETSLLYKYSSAIQGFILWGCWAFYVNSKVSFSAGVIAGLIQGTFSFIATLVVIYLLTRLFNYFEARFIKLLVPPVVMITGLITIMVSIHVVAETPKIITTVAPSIIVAVLFISFTTYKLASAKTR